MCHKRYGVDQKTGAWVGNPGGVPCGRHTSATLTELEVILPRKFLSEESLGRRRDVGGVLEQSQRRNPRQRINESTTMRSEVKRNQRNKRTGRCPTETACRVSMSRVDSIGGVVWHDVGRPTDTSAQQRRRSSSQACLCRSNVPNKVEQVQAVH
ncbi:MAG: hypothetical protein MHM6MM_001676 [Cercozoa sp. M6MM]